LDEAQRVAAEIGPSALARRIDVTDTASLRKALADCDLLVSTVGPFFRFGVPVLQAAIDMGVSYADINDDWEPTCQMLELDEAASAAGITAVIGIGASPGISNMLAAVAARSLDEVFELHTGWPLAAHTLVTSAEWLGAAAAAFASHVVAGAAPTERGPQLAQRSLMCATGLLPLVGYDRAAAVAKAAAEQGSSVAEAAAELCGDVDVGALRRAVHPSALLGPRDTPEPPA
jgi:hypothetical protein